MNITPLKPVPHKLSEAEAESLIHDSYLMQIREQSCHHCQSGERWSELFEVWTHPTKTHRTAAYVLRPTLTLRSGYEVAYTKLPTTIVPVCSDCIDTFNVDTAQVIPAASHEAWKDTLRRKYAVEPTKPTTPRHPEPRLDQL